MQQCYYSNHYIVQNDQIIYIWSFTNQITELHLEIVMITNYPTLKIKTHLNLILQMF